MNAKRRNQTTRLQKWSLRETQCTRHQALPSSAFTWFTRPCPKFWAFLLGGPELWGAVRLTPEAAVLLLAIDWVGAEFAAL
jgi:hypothetical protein